MEMAVRIKMTGRTEAVKTVLAEVEDVLSQNTSKYVGGALDGYELTIAVQVPKRLTPELVPLALGDEDEENIRALTELYGPPKVVDRDNLRVFEWSYSCGTSRGEDR